MGTLSVISFPIKNELNIMTHLTGFPEWAHPHAIPTALKSEFLRLASCKVEASQSANTSSTFQVPYVLKEWVSSKIFYLQAVWKYLFHP